MLQSLDDFKVLFIQSWCFKHPSLPPPPPQKKILLQSTMFYPKDIYQKQMVVKLFF